MAPVTQSLRSYAIRRSQTTSQEKFHGLCSQMFLRSQHCEMRTIKRYWFSFWPLIWEVDTWCSAYFRIQHLKHPKHSATRNGSKTKIGNPSNTETLSNYERTQVQRFKMLKLFSSKYLEKYHNWTSLMNFLRTGSQLTEVWRNFIFKMEPTTSKNVLFRNPSISAYINKMKTD